MCKSMRKAKPASSRASPKIGVSASKTPRCAMGAKVGVCGWMDTSGMCERVLDSGLIRAVGITPANIAEASVTKAISEDLEQQDVGLKELHIDRAYLSSHLVRERSDELEVYCKAWPV